MRALFLLFFLLAAAPSHGAVASWYGEEHRGRLMANGERFDPDRMTCASWFYPLGTKLKVQWDGWSQGDRWVIVTVTDRGPHRRLVRQGRTIDLSRAAFDRIGRLELGLIPVRIVRLWGGGYAK